jgi:uncharacterized protein YecE (DUF72 family)
MTMYVGTSGWAYKEWKPGFYPEDLPQARFLEHYSNSLGACEVNATFYRLQSEETFTKWSALTPDSFRFTTKVHRRLTHTKSIAPDGEQRSFLDTYLKSVQTLGPRLGAVLFQFPPYRRRDDDAFRALLQALPAGAPYAFEFRHESWTSHEIEDLIAAAGGTICISNTDGTVPAALPPGPIAYVRLRTERYTEEARSGWLELLKQESKERPVFAFAKHEGIPAEDPYGGIGLAEWLVREVG